VVQMGPMKIKSYFFIDMTHDSLESHEYSVIALSVPGC
jgi:hypothetical protein